MTPQAWRPVLLTLQVAPQAWRPVLLTLQVAPQAWRPVLLTLQVAPQAWRPVLLTLQVAPQAWRPVLLTLQVAPQAWRPVLLTLQVAPQAWRPVLLTLSGGTSGLASSSTHAGPLPFLLDWGSCPSGSCAVFPSLGSTAGAARCLEAGVCACVDPRTAPTWCCWASGASAALDAVPG
ncbi:hypothetical protein NDU88_000199 [Pleurodeles waltl]|uniref:Uncharacterized protein n=1 Tax=Pleurodeles waltl TaxID=8319 RepID=A0AAV7MH73_PLEWA|nr:hypothetical protein NDU88_000199 [Pleurodeles waltl]